MATMSCSGLSIVVLLFVWLPGDWLAVYNYYANITTDPWTGRLRRLDKNEKYQYELQGRSNDSP